MKDNNKDIYKIEHILHRKVIFEPPRPKRTLPQCTTCQKYGHTKNYPVLLTQDWTEQALNVRYAVKTTLQTIKVVWCTNHCN